MEKLITTTDDLKKLCEEAEKQPFVTMDTEFVRERTYWPVLCLVQLATAERAVCIDPLAKGIDLAPLVALLRNPKVLKVFHAARQDIECFHHLTGVIPEPIFDTQVAAMVCGYGDSVSYQQLVENITHTHLDKAMRFTDWAERPLSPRQVEYALGDVTHLRKVYAALAAELEKNGRASWIGEEMRDLLSPETYAPNPFGLFRKLEPRGASPKVRSVLYHLIEWRENMAMERNVPRRRILQDETMVEMAFVAPQSEEELGKIRSCQGRRIKDFDRIAPVIAKGAEEAAAFNERFRQDEKPKFRRPPKALMEVLRLLLSVKCAQEGVSTRLIASAAELEKFAAEKDPGLLPFLSGWRAEFFGNDARRMKNGELAVSYDLKRQKIEIVER